jgi:hypothetical protein
MGIIFLALWLTFVMKLWFLTKQNLFCAAVFVIPRLLLALITGMPFLGALVEAAVIFGWLSLYFWLMDRMVKPGTHWLIVFFGLVITVALALFLRFLLYW